MRKWQPDWQAEWLRPGDRIQRGYKLFECDRVAVSDIVVIEARRVQPDGSLGEPEHLEFAQHETVRATLGPMWPSPDPVSSQPSLLP